MTIETPKKLETLAHRLREVRSVLLTTHAQPDGDGIGSELALAAALDQLGHSVHIVNCDPTPSRFAFLDPHNRIQVWHDGFKLPAVDLAVVLDTQPYEMLGCMAEPMR
ncbi:MAG: hypothetical protein GF355_01965, partial [Candidatus Eisenbacteria bacterium]|nr:hypothetical protein [Candidatus Eisenbacteria bacterium]